MSYINLMMACANERIRNRSGKLVERGSLSSKRYYDQRTCKFVSKDHQVLAPVLRNPERSEPVKSTDLDEGELLFEYFECDQPQQRTTLYEKIKELARGDTSSDSKVYGDPSKLECLNLHDLHPASWYSVAWYPIYRIPDGKFRAAFLTYHSLGHFSPVPSKRPGGIAHIVSPVVGLQSYNAKGECWFKPRGQISKAVQTGEALSLDPSDIVKQRLDMLEHTASVMARASVCKNNRRSANKHPDYEFFMSRRW